jgi:hypothetical protein
MEILIELTEAELREVAGGKGSASLTGSNVAAGPVNATVTSTVHQFSNAGSANNSFSLHSTSS